MSSERLAAKASRLASEHEGRRRMLQENLPVATRHDNAVHCAEGVPEGWKVFAQVENQAAQVYFVSPCGKIMTHIDQVQEFLHNSSEEAVKRDPKKGDVVEAEMENPVKEGAIEWVRGRVKKTNLQKRTFQVVFNVQEDDEEGNWEEEYSMDVMDEWRWPRLTIEVLQKCGDTVEESCRRSLQDSVKAERQDETATETVVKVEAPESRSHGPRKSVERFRIKVLLNTLKKMDGLKNFETFTRWSDLMNALKIEPESLGVTYDKVRSVLKKFYKKHLNKSKTKEETSGKPPEDSPISPVNSPAKTPRSKVRLVGEKIIVGMELEAEMSSDHGAKEWMRGTVTDINHNNHTFEMEFNVHTTDEVGNWKEVYKFQELDKEWRFPGVVKDEPPRAARKSKSSSDQEVNVDNGNCPSADLASLEPSNTQTESIDCKYEDLYKIVNELGGFSAVDNGRKWAQVARALNVNTRVHRTAGSRIKAFYKSFHFPSTSVACKDDPETEEISKNVQVGMEIEAEMEDGKGGTEWIRGKVAGYDKAKKTLSVFFSVQTETEIGEWTDEYRIEDFGKEWRFIPEAEETMEICEITESQPFQHDELEDKFQALPDESIRICSVNIRLHKLLRLVYNEGGPDSCTNNKRWTSIAKKLTIDPKKFTNCAFLMKKTYMNHIYPIIDDVNARSPQIDEELMVKVNHNGKEEWKAGKVISVETPSKTFMVQLHQRSDDMTDHPKSLDVLQQEGSSMQIDTEAEDKKFLLVVGPFRTPYVNREWKWCESHEQDSKTEVTAEANLFQMTSIQANKSQLHSDNKRNSSSRKKRDREVAHNVN
eukprot:756279-Hanusia_phi.AAC.2